MPISTRRLFRFDPFEVDFRSGELRKHGLRLKLSGQPIQVLEILIENSGQVVTRQELHKTLWKDDTFVDFERGLNAAVNRLREALSDSPTEPRYVETIPRYGYRFIAAVSAEPESTSPPQESLTPEDALDPAEGASEDSGGEPAVTVSPVLAKRRWRFWGSGVAALVVFTAFGIYSYRRSAAFSLTPKDTIVLADFQNSTGEVVFDDALRQALVVGLEQSPFLQVLSDRKASVVLRQMAHSPDEHVTGAIAVELCQRAGGKVAVQGSISSLGTTYFIGLTAVRCDNGEPIYRGQVEAKRKEDVVDALGTATIGLRAHLGESVSSLRKYDAALEQATTPSLEALKAYSHAISAWDKQGDLAAIPLLEKAVELDPNFAMAYGSLAETYQSRGESELANKNAIRAYELRSRVTEFERLQIEAWYYVCVTGDLEKALAVNEMAVQTYPVTSRTLNDLGTAYGNLGQYGRAKEYLQQSLRLDPAEIAYGNLSSSLIALDLTNEAEATLRQAASSGIQSDYLQQIGYWLAFLRQDNEEMKRILAGANTVPGTLPLLLSEQANSEAYYGHFEKARELSSTAAQQLIGEGRKEAAGACLAQAAVREAEAGNARQARELIAKALKLTRDQTVLIMAALVAARTNDLSAARAYSEQLDKSYPTDTFIQKYWLPIVRAEIEVQQGNGTTAVSILNVSEPLDFAAPPAFSSSTLYPAYVRGEAYLAAGDGTKAAAEFQKLVDHPGMVLNFPLGALARLGRARAYALLPGSAKAREAYQDFFQHWKDADPHVPILIQANREFHFLSTT